MCGKIDLSYFHIKQKTTVWRMHKSGHHKSAARLVWQEQEFLKRYLRIPRLFKYPPWRKRFFWERKSQKDTEPPLKRHIVGLKFENTNVNPGGGSLLLADVPLGTVYVQVTREPCGHAVVLRRKIGCTSYSLAIAVQFISIDKIYGTT